MRSRRLRCRRSKTICSSKACLLGLTCSFASTLRYSVGPQRRTFYSGIEFWAQKPPMPEYSLSDKRLRRLCVNEEISAATPSTMARSTGAILHASRARKQLQHAATGCGQAKLSLARRCADARPARSLLLLQAPKADCLRARRISAGRTH